MKEATTRERIIITVVIVISFLLIYFGNQIVMRDVAFFNSDNDLIVGKAEVTGVLNDTPNEYNTILFECLVIEGEKAGQTIVAAQAVEPVAGDTIKQVEKGDVIFLGDASGFEAGADWFFYEYERSGGVLWLGIAFGVLLIIFGRSKGFRTIISLLYTCVTIFFVFIPAILAGYNVYLSAIMTCIFITATTLLIVQGPNSKTLAAGFGCIGGLFVVSLITVGMSQILKLSGLVDQESYFLLYLDTAEPINLRAIVFASITIGAAGAILDIAVDISASLSEVHRHAPNLSLWQTVKSGITIGQDIVGSMANTLILAYIGSSLSLILLLLVHSGSPEDLLNSELITIEILQALAGSIGILFAIPLTAFSCGILYNRPHRKLKSGTMPDAAQTEQS